MIERYTRSEMGRIWSDLNRYGKWLEVEILVCEALARSGEIPAEAVRDIRSRARIDIRRIREIEAEVHHDVIAFITQIAETVKPHGRFLHLGLTSSDVLDSGFAMQLAEATELLAADVKRLMAVLETLAIRHKNTVMIGRPHGIHAEPITFGLKLASWYAEMKRGLARLELAAEEVRTLKLSGAVGTFANIAPQVERYVCQRLGLNPEPVATQIVCRDRHAIYFATLAVIGCSLERIAVEIRHLQRTEVGEVAEPFAATQRGSSAMPHKRNPVLAENVTGLARLLRAYAGAAFENVALWHERDISHSSVERVIAPDATTVLDFMLNRVTGILEHLCVYPERMRENLWRLNGVTMSEDILLALVQRGADRQEAYGWVQRAAQGALSGRGDFPNLLAAEEGISRLLPRTEIERLLDPKRHLAHIDYVFERVFGGGRSGGC